MNRALLMTFAAVMVAGVGYVYFGQPQPTAGQGAPLAVVQLPVLSEEEKDGEVAYAQYCASCHGKDGAGQEGVAPPFVHRIYEPNHHGDAAFMSAALNGVRAHHWTFGDMPPVEGVTPQEVGKIITYVRALQRANGIQ